MGGADAEACLEQAALRHSFRTGSTGSLRQIDSRPVLDTEDPSYLAWREGHPCVLEQFDSFLQLVRGKRLVVFLDYDGTLTPIVNDPENAKMSQEMRAAVRDVARRFPTAVVSGRGLAKVQEFVQLRELFYAGSHGMDIAGPRKSEEEEGLHETVDAFRHQAAADFKDTIDKVYEELCEALQEFPNAWVEHNTFCVSAHYRNCITEIWKPLWETVRKVVERHNEKAEKSHSHTADRSHNVEQGMNCFNKLHITEGRKVLEVRPEVDWHKGNALLHLLRVLELATEPDVVALYMGDDTTDEDAFSTLAERNAGIGVLVSTKAKQTKATFTVRDPSEVQAFLLRLAREYAPSSANGWHAHGSHCNGWAPAATAHAPENGNQTDVEA